MRGAVLVGGGWLVWDLLSFRITEPPVYSGSVVSVEVLVQGVGQRQRTAYPEGATLSLSAAPAALKEHRIMIEASGLHGG